MAGHLRFPRFMESRRHVFLLVALTGCVGAFAADGEGKGASGLADPMRPPAALLDPVSTATATPAPSGLQTVIVRRSGGSTAVINGQIVEVGGKLGDARLVAVSESQAELQGPGGREIMRMTPAVDIRHHVAPSVPPAKAVKKKKRGGGKVMPSKSKSNKRP